MGHSQGTSQMFYAAATEQDLIASKVNLFVACAPVTRMNGTSSSIKITSSHLSMVEGALYHMSIHEIFYSGYRNEWNTFMSSFTGKMLGSMKDLIVKALGSSASYNNEERGIVASNRFPNEASTKELFHYG